MPLSDARQKTSTRKSSLLTFVWRCVSRLYAVHSWVFVMFIVRMYARSKRLAISTPSKDVTGGDGGAVTSDSKVFGASTVSRMFLMMYGSP